MRQAVATFDVAGYLRAIAGQAGSLMQGTVLVILFVGFLFAERVWFDTKLESLLGDKAQADRAGRIIGSIIHRVNYYLLVKTLVSGITGLMVYGVARLFELDLAGALGILDLRAQLHPRHRLDRGDGAGGAGDLRATGRRHR